MQEGFDVGSDTISPVSNKYKSPFPFTGKINRVTIDISKASFAELTKRQRPRKRKWRWGRSDFDEVNFRIAATVHLNQEIVRLRAGQID